MQTLVVTLALAAFSATPIQALASWLQVYVGAMKHGTVFEISNTDRNIHALKKAVKVEKAEEMSHCDADELNVFAVGTSVPIPDGTEHLAPSKTVPGGTTSKKPLIVVAPLPPQQQRYKPEKEFDLKHLKSIKVDDPGLIAQRASISWDALLLPHG